MHGANVHKQHNNWCEKVYNVWHGMVQPSDKDVEKDGCIVTNAVVTVEVKQKRI